MGYVPLFVALLALIVLYTLYTYNLIKPRKARLTRVIDQMAENSRNRKNLILEHDRNHENSSLAEVASLLKKASTDRFQSYRKEEEFINAIGSAVNALDDHTLGAQLKEANSKQQELIQKLESTAREYNDFIKKAPASMVASIFGFRQF